MLHLSHIESGEWLHMPFKLSLKTISPGSQPPCWFDRSARRAVVSRVNAYQINTSHAHSSIGAHTAIWYGRWHLTEQHLVGWHLHLIQGWNYPPNWEEDAIDLNGKYRAASCCQSFEEKLVRNRGYVQIKPYRCISHGFAHPIVKKFMFMGATRFKN